MRQPTEAQRQSPAAMSRFLSVVVRDAVPIPQIKVIVSKSRRVARWRVSCAKSALGWSLFSLSEPSCFRRHMATLSDAQSAKVSLTRGILPCTQLGYLCEDEESTLARVLRPAALYT